MPCSACTDANRCDRTGICREFAKNPPAVTRLQAVAPLPDDFDAHLDVDEPDEPYCGCGNSPTIDESDWGVCSSCGKPLPDSH